MPLHLQLNVPPAGSEIDMVVVVVVTNKMEIQKRIFLSHHRVCSQKFLMKKYLYYSCSVELIQRFISKPPFNNSAVLWTACCQW
jgi:hypothetical protein